jgi:lipopolysaccharide export LptBFGC system permease protein LptF
VADGQLPPIVGTWWVHLAVLSLALVWLQRQGRMVGKG